MYFFLKKLSTLTLVRLSYPLDKGIEICYTLVMKKEKVTINPRKEYPVYTGFLKYFPDAIQAVAHLSYVANEQHNPGEILHWAKEKSTDEPDAMMRHLLDHAKGTRYDSDGILHITKVCWRSLSFLQRELEKEQKNGKV